MTDAVSAYWPAVFRRLPADVEIVMFDADVAGSSRLPAHAMVVLVGPARVRVPVSARITQQLRDLTIAGVEANGEAALAAIRALAHVRVSVRRLPLAHTRYDGWAHRAIAGARSRIWQYKRATECWPRLTPGVTTFKLADGTDISLANWIDDRTFGTLAIGFAAPSLTVFTATAADVPPVPPRRLKPP